MTYDPNPYEVLFGTITVPYTTFVDNFPTLATATIDLGSLGVTQYLHVVDARLVIRTFFAQSGGGTSDVVGFLGGGISTDPAVQGLLINGFGMLSTDIVSPGSHDSRVCAGDPTNQDPAHVYLTLVLGNGTPSVGNTFSTLNAGAVVCQVWFNKKT
jgi:hypothetical protein